MNHLIGSAVEIFCEIPAAKVTGTTLTLESLTDPDGTELAASEALTFSTETGKTNIASVIWQSSEVSHLSGKYKYIIKALNGTRENFEKGYFYITEE
jgi:hypothetical protein